MAKKKPVIEPHYLDHLASAGPAELAAEIPKYPGCGDQIVAAGILHHQLRCISDDNVAETVACLRAVLADAPKLSKARNEKGSLLEWIVRARPIDGPTRLSLLREAMALGADPHLVDGYKKFSAWSAAKDLGDEESLALFRDTKGAAAAPASLNDAVVAGDLDAVKRLVPGHHAEPGDPATLVLAISTSKTDIARLLVEHGIGIVAPPGTRSALHAAAGARDVELIRALLDKGAPADAVDKTDRDLTPLQLAAMGSVFDMGAFELLFAHRKPTAEALVGDGWEWLWPSLSGPAVALIASELGPTLTTKKSQISLLHVAASRGEKGAADVVAALLARGADPTAKTAKKVLFGGIPVDKGATPLAVATALDRAASIAALSAAEAKPAAKTPAKEASPASASKTPAAKAPAKPRRR